MYLVIKGLTSDNWEAFESREAMLEYIKQEIDVEQHRFKDTNIIALHGNVIEVELQENLEVRLTEHP